MVHVDPHVHTEYSVLDGLTTCRESVARAAENGSPALAITDHGTCAGHPEFQHECNRAGIAPIFGIEAYFQQDRRVRPAEGDKEAQKRLRGGSHLILLAQGNRGLHDMWAASTEAFATGHYGKPRMDWEVLEERGSDLIATTSCLGGIISQDLLNGRYDQAWKTLDRLKAAFRDRLYLEIQANELPDQIRLNKMLAMAGEEFGIPLIAACDAHYPSEEDHALHKLWMLCQSGKGKEDYWHFSAMLPETRIREMLAYLDPKVVDAAIRSTVEVADRCTARIDGQAEPPVFTPGGSYADDARRLRYLCEENWHRIKNPTQAYRDRMEYEFKIVADKNFAGCYLIVHDIVSWVRGNGWLVGPGRGSAAGSLMSYLCGITSIDPLRAGLMFERFLTPGRAAMPDFDMDFPSSKRPQIQDYAITKYGAEHVVRVGTVMRYGAKGILNKLFSMLADKLPDEAQADSRQIAGLIDEAEIGTAGLGLPWDEIMAEQAIQAFAARYKVIFDIAKVLIGRVYSLGQHPAGLVISPGVPLPGTLPMRLADTSKTLLVSQWDYRAVEARGWLKLDFLTLRNLDFLQMTIELVAQRTGYTPDPWSWDIEHDDPQVYDMIGTGNTLGTFQTETSLGQDYCRRHRPRSIGDLSDLTTYIRPGPRNSGAAESYLRRHFGLEEIDYAHPLLREQLERSYGLLLYQEDILAACRLIAGYDDLKADGVRKILGKKLTDKIDAAGEEFVRCSVERGHDEAQIRALWEKIAEFGKYAFNRCLTGDTKIHLAASSQHTGGTADVAYLYHRLHAPELPVSMHEDQGPCVVCGSTSSAAGWVRGVCNACRVWRRKFHDPKRGLYGLSYWADGRIRPARIVDVIAQGEKETWKITLRDGRSITATGNHRHLTDAGYRRVDELLPGDSLIIDAGYEKDHHDPARHRLTRGERQREGAVSGAFGESNYGFVDGGAAFWEQWRKTNPKVCAQCGIAQGRIEVAHLDGDHANNTDGNLAWLCASCHKAYDYAHNDRRRRWQKGHRSEAVQIESIEYAGFQETYDVVMESPHNFVANGIVTHNSHAYSYATLSYWTAWFKVHYPVEMLTGILSTLKEMDRMAAYATEARRMGIQVLPPDVRFCGAGFTVEGLSIRYGLSAIPKVGPAAITKITRSQPYAAYDDFTSRSGVDAGVLYALARAGALDALVPSRKGVLRSIEADRDGTSVLCIHKDPEAEGPNRLPCAYDWENEPQPAPVIGKRGLPLKVIVKPPPEKCWKACRRYTPPPRMDLAAFGEFKPAALFRQDFEVYGTWMADAPFAQLEQFGEGMRDRARRVALMIAGAPEGTYPVAAVYGGYRTARTRAGNAMYWVSLVTEVSAFDLACFNPRFDGEPDLPAVLRTIRQGTLVSAEVIKRSYQVPGRSVRMGWRLSDIWPIGG